MTTYTQEEQKAHRKLWVEALRSGKYEQAKGVLQKNGGFCCLGLACEISGLGEWEDRGYDFAYLVGTERGHTAVLPTVVMNWLGLRDDCGAIIDDDALSTRNDKGSTFAEIADVIEAEPEGLVVK